MPLLPCTCYHRYGTLQAKGVCQALLKRVPASKPASITGYSRYKVKNAVFPAIVPETPEKIVHGMVSKFMAMRNTDQLGKSTPITTDCTLLAVWFVDCTAAAATDDDDAGVALKEKHEAFALDDLAWKAS